MRRARLLLITCAAALAVGCAVVVDPPPPNSVPGSVSSRPRELPLDGLDPCTLLTPEQRRGLGLDLSSDPFPAPAPLAGRTCSMSGDVPRAIHVIIALATDTAFANITDLSASTGGYTPTMIAGYPDHAIETTGELLRRCRHRGGPGLRRVVSRRRPLATDPPGATLPRRRPGR